MGERVTLCTIGFAKKSLRKFIGLLQDAGVTKVIDIRLHNTSQLAGYAKRDDLEFILETFGIAYEHVPELAPTEELMKSYKKGSTDWETYTVAFEETMEAMYDFWKAGKIRWIGGVQLRRAASGG